MVNLSTDVVRVSRLILIEAMMDPTKGSVSLKK